MVSANEPAAGIVVSLPLVIIRARMQRFGAPNVLKVVCKVPVATQC